MENAVWLGVLLAVLGGVFNGIFALPMRLMTKWKWETTWMVYCLVLAVYGSGSIFWYVLLIPGAQQVFTSTGEQHLRF